MDLEIIILSEVSQTGKNKYHMISLICEILENDVNELLNKTETHSQTQKNNYWFSQQITEEIKKEIKVCIETNENENTTTQSLLDTVKRVLRGRFIAIEAYLKKQEKIQINNPTLHLKQLEKEEIENPRVSRRKEILKIREEINAE